MSRSNRQMFEDISQADIQDIVRNPNRFGAPTFEQFKASRDKYIGRPDDTFGIIDQGSKNLSGAVQRHEYEIEGYRCKTLEEVERVASEQLGININNLDYRPELIPQGGGKCNVLIKFVSKADRERRAEWG